MAARSRASPVPLPFSSLALLLFLLILSHLQLVAADGVNVRDFRSWYPQYGSIFRKVLDTTCGPQYDAYVSGNLSVVEGGGQLSDGANTPGEEVVQCLLSAASEFMKANMASAGVLLGITPFALSVLGSSSEESALLFVIARRPLLTVILLAGSPVVVALRPFEYKDPFHILRSREERFSSLRLGPSWLVLTIQYVVALGALANVVHVTYQLCVGVVTMIWPDAVFLPALWVGTGIVVHGIGAMCLRSRLRVQSLETAQSRSSKWLPFAWLRSEFSLSSRKNITIETVQERKLFLALSWITSTSTTFHVIFGTLAFSSMQFISVQDAFGVIGRYTASVTVCRVIVMYELSGLRESVRRVVRGSVVDEGDSDTEGPKGKGIPRMPRIFTLSTE